MYNKNVPVIRLVPKLQLARYQVDLQSTYVPVSGPGGVGQEPGPAGRPESSQVLTIRRPYSQSRCWRSKTVNIRKDDIFDAVFCSPILKN
jgi:hypothetical protein